MSWKMLTANWTRPSSSRIGAARTSDQRSSSWPRVRELHRERGPAGPEAGHLDGRADDGPLAGLEVSGQTFPVLVAIPVRDDRLGHLPADDVVARSAEQRLCGPVELHDATGMVD